MGPFPVQAKSMKELVVHCFDNLADPRQPATQSFRPWPPAMLLGGTDHWGPIGLLPHRMVCLPCEALIDPRRSQGWGSRTGPPRLRPAAPGKERLGQRLVFGARRAKAQASHGAD